MNVQLYNHHYNTRDDKFVYEVLAVVVSFDGMGRWLCENKKWLSYRDIESLEDNHECDYLGLKLIDTPLITSDGGLKWKHFN